MQPLNAGLAVLATMFCSSQRDGATLHADTPSSIPLSAQPVVPDQSQAPKITIALQQVAGGFQSPVYLTSPAGDSRLFVVEQAGRILIVMNGAVVPKPFLDIRDKVGSGGERGLLSVAFHPLYRTNGFLFVNYNDKNGDTNIERYAVSRDPDVADSASAKRILKINQPYSNHNGGMNLFGPDGMLYIGMGDGGSEGDPHSYGQDNTTLLSKLLRIDVDHGDPYSAPSANGLANSGGRPEIWATGLRNPWRFAFDAKDGNLYIADVGQNTYEEVDVVPMNRAGVNYGWSIMEGFHCLHGFGCNQSGLQRPVLVYSHDDGCSITGGFVYRGKAIPALDGHYFYADYCGSWLKSFKYVNGRVTEHTTWPVEKLSVPASFGLDGSGEMYIVGHGGRIYKIVPASRTPQ